MKGTIKKLNLKRETLRELSRDEAQAVHGGLRFSDYLLAFLAATSGTNAETCSGYCSK